MKSYVLTEESTLFNTHGVHNHGVFLSLKVVLILANTADPDEMQHYAAFHLGLYCLPKYRFRGFQYTKGYSSKIRSTSTISEKVMYSQKKALYSTPMESINHGVFLSLKVVLILANNADPDEMHHSCCILSGSSLFAKVPVKGFPVYKGLLK